ncbi:MAG: NusG domain II-containing protein [Lachnospiraceae bacterium]|nr:NusG domain II-containing protein [Lachnospiraceae bacterium]
MSAKKFIAKFGLFLCLIGIGLFILFLTITQKNDGTHVIVSVNGKDIECFELAKDITYDIDTYGLNRLTIKDGYAWIDTADCPDKLCVNFGKISKSGESIVCLPHKVVIRIESNISDKEGLDAIAK